MNTLFKRPSFSSTLRFPVLPLSAPRSPFTRARKGSFSAGDFPAAAGSDGAGSGSDGAGGAKEQPSGAAAERRGEPGGEERNLQKDTKSDPWVLSLLLPSAT